MNLVYGTNEDVFIEDGMGLNSKYVNESLQKLLQNDKSLSQLSNFEPQIWECKWFNDDSISGYEKGYAVWLNTEDEKQFIINHSDEIYDYSKNHYILKQIIQPFDQSNIESYYLYRNIMNGFTYTQKNIKLSPMYFIGDIEECAQIRISLKDNNKDTPDTLSSWKDFFIRNIDKISSVIDSERQYSEDYHLSCYHYSGMSLSEFLSKDEFADNSLSNVQTQRFQSHYIESNLCGFDYTQSEQYLSSNDTINMVSSEISGISAYFLEELSNHGYYTIKDYWTIMRTHLKWDKYANITWCLSTANNFEDINLPFVIRNLTEEEFVGNITFSLTSNTEGKTYYPFSADMSYFGYLISTMNKYDITNFYVGKISSYYPTNPSTGNYDFNEDFTHPISATRFREIEKVSADYDYVEIGQKEIDFNLSGYGLVSSWYRIDKSGYTEQGGCIDINGYSIGDIKICLKYEYDYPISENDYYGEYSSDNDDLIGFKYGYQINITPIYDSYDQYEKTINIYEVRNDSFKLQLENSNITKIFYVTRGFRKV